MRRFMLALCFAVCFAGFVPAEAYATKIVVDAGHGGKDPGAHGINGLEEKEAALDIATRLRDELNRRGYEAVMSRTDDRFISLQERVDFTNEQKADLFVSVHANWYKNPDSNGTMVLYYDDAYPQSDYPASDEMKALTPKSRAFADSVLQSLVSAAGTKNLGLTPSSVYVVRMGTIPSILVETAFLSNSQNAELLAEDSMRSRMAAGIADGIADWVPSDFADLAGHWARDAIERMKSKGIVDGKISGFDPNGALTRAEFVTMLNRIFDFSKQIAAGQCTDTTVTAAVYQNPCKPGAAAAKDLPSSHWASDAMRKALELGVINGYPDGTVRPDVPVSREEVAVLLDRMIGDNGSIAAKGVFADVPSESWSAQAIARLKAKGIIDGMSDGRFAPKRSISRAEICAMLDRYLK